MDEFAHLPSEDRRLYFEQAAARLGLAAAMVEKDFWRLLKVALPN